MRDAIANAYELESENILVGNGSNELLAASIATFVGPGTTVALPKPTFPLYEKLITIAGFIYDVESGEIDDLVRWERD